MRNIIVSTSSNNQTNSALSTLSEVLNTYGFKDERSISYTADVTENLIQQDFIKALEAYEKNPTEIQIKKWQQLLKKEIKRINEQYQLAKRKQDEYQAKLEQNAKVIANMSYAGQLKSWLLNSAKWIFNSDYASLVQHYREIANNRAKHLLALQTYYDQAFSEPNTSSNPPSSQFPPSFSLTNLNGQNGFELSGENNGDQSGYSVVGVGDVNGDGIDDFAVGAPNENSATGAAYLIFGRNTWVTPISLSNLNGLTGVKFPGEKAGDMCGAAVSATDLNGDGISDFVIGAYQANGNVGVVYVVFGHTGPWATPFSLSNLNGINGVKFIGENAISWAGYAVTSAGDLNHDGIKDLGIGAYRNNVNAGATYVVFGHKGAWTSPFNLINLNGNNGVKFAGQYTYDYSGISVNYIGDLNHDGIDDLGIGGSNAYQGSGVAYVIFGHAGSWATPFNLASLNGFNGVIFFGNGDSSGRSISFAGDFNHDNVDDVIIGAPGVNNGAGGSYLIFGRYGQWHSPIYLSSLNITSGIKFINDVLNAFSGRSVAFIRDVNGDGIDDVLIGAYGVSCNYVVFGQSHPQIATISLSSLNGINGIKLIGMHASDDNGYSVSSAGDINKDGKADFLMGAFSANSVAGATYVVFGDDQGQLLNNQLAIQEGQSIVLNATHLNATYGNAAAAQIQFVISNLQYGAFVLVNSQNQAITLFTQQQINTQQIRFISNGSCFAPSYSVSVNAGKLSYIPAVIANITYTSIAPMIVTNQLAVNQDQSIILTLNNVNITDPGESPSSLQIMISAMQNGYFSLINNPNTAILQFNLQQIMDGEIQFTVAMGTNLPSYQITIQDSCGFTTGPEAATIDFNLSPTLENNQLTVNQNETVVLTLENISAFKSNSTTNLLFFVQNVQHGKFTRDNESTPITQFSQLDIVNGLIQFTQDGSNQIPSYAVQVRDDRGAASDFQTAQITFDATPVLTVNQLNILQGRPVVLSATNIDATHVTNSWLPLRFIVSNLQHGYFSFIHQPAQNIVLFFQTNITEGLVQFVQDNTRNKPSYQLAVSDGILTTLPQSAMITFNSRPTLLTNQLMLNQGQVIIINSADMSASDGETLASNLQFVVSHVRYGQFEYVSNFGVAITFFQQGDVIINQIRFIPDGSRNAPSYDLLVSDGVFSDGPYSATVTFNQLPLLLVNQLTLNQGENVVLTENNLNATDTRVVAADLLFMLTNIQHGHFEYTNDFGTVITDFYLRNISDRMVRFVTDGGSVPPRYNTAVSNGMLSTAPVSALINFNSGSGGNASVISDNTIRNALIGASISGAFGFFLCILRMYLGHKVNQRLVNATRPSQGLEKQRELQEHIIRPLMERIWQEVTFTTCGYASDKTVREMAAYVLLLVTALNRQQVPIDLNEAQSLQQILLIEIVARETRRALVTENNCCSCCISLVSFFRAQATPKQFKDKIELIAAAVKQELKPPHRSVELDEIKMGSNALTRDDKAGGSLSLPLLSAGSNSN